MNVVLPHAVAAFPTVGLMDNEMAWLLSAALHGSTCSWERRIQLDRGMGRSTSRASVAQDTRTGPTAVPDHADRRLLDGKQHVGNKPSNNNQQKHRQTIRHTISQQPLISTTQQPPPWGAALRSFGAFDRGSSRSAACQVHGRRAANATAGKAQRRGMVSQ